MLFNSFAFVIFFIVVLFLYYSIPKQYRWMLLLAGSYFFYMCWKVEYIVLIIASTLIDYLVGLRLSKTENSSTRTLLLVISILTNLGILFTYKYMNFFGENINFLANYLANAYASQYGMSAHAQYPLLKLLLPVGISFYTFQSMSYTIDVYRRVTTPEKHLGYFAVYVSFFPQLVAGPIERSNHLLPQFREDRQATSAEMVAGLRLMLWGAFKKIVIADQISVVVNTVYETPQEYSGPFLLLATFFFAMQIYCDFSGYSDIAIGCAKTMGFDLMTNFRRPYFASSLGEFWRRWHISLSTWFRDYVYFPLGGNRVAPWAVYLNILTVFIISGLWHGAAWTFIIWGLIHGLILVAERLIAQLRGGEQQSKQKPMLLIRILKQVLSFGWC